MYPKPPLTEYDAEILAEALGESKDQVTEQHLDILKIKYESVVASKFYLRLAYDAMTAIHNVRVNINITEAVPIFSIFIQVAVGATFVKCDMKSMLWLLYSTLKLKDLDSPWSLQDLQNAINDAGKKLQRLKKTIKVWGKPLGQTQAVEEYTEVGLKLLESGKVDKLIRLVSDLQPRDHYSRLLSLFVGIRCVDDCKPAILVCSYLGFRKRLLPFALAHRYPVLYLLDVPVQNRISAKLQNINQSFIDISRAMLCRGQGNAGSRSKFD